MGTANAGQRKSGEPGRVFQRCPGSLCMHISSGSLGQLNLIDDEERALLSRFRRGNDFFFIFE